MKTIPDRAPVHTQELCFRRGFCDGAKLRRDDLESVVSQYILERFCSILCCSVKIYYYSRGSR